MKETEQEKLGYLTTYFPQLAEADQDKVLAVARALLFAQEIGQECPSVESAKAENDVPPFK